MRLKMDQEPHSGYNPDAVACPVGETFNSLYSTSFESVPTDWSTNNSNVWFWSSDYAHTGLNMMWGADGPQEAGYLTLDTAISIPINQPAYLHFAHSFGFENPDYDGGFLEYSTNGGSTWLDASSLFDAGLDYNGTIRSGEGNPEGGEAAFIGDSHGYVSSRYDLSSLVDRTSVFVFA